jgi:hypothetical protein
MFKTDEKMASNTAGCIFQDVTSWLCEIVTTQADATEHARPPMAEIRASQGIH